MDSEIVRTSRVDKITAWGGKASVQHIQKFLVPGIELLSMNPKYSFSVVGKEAFENEAAMKEAATGVAIQAGKFNQGACASTRLVYVESGTDEDSVEKLVQFGELVYEAFQNLPSYYSTPADGPNKSLEGEMRAIEPEEDFYWVKGDTVKGGVIVSKFEGKVDFSNELINRVVNIVPVTSWTEMLNSVDDTSQTIPIYPASLRLKLREELAVRGAQRMLPLRADLFDPVETGSIASLPHDGNETMRRSVRWMIDQGPLS